MFLRLQALCQSSSVAAAMGNKRGFWNWEFGISGKMLLQTYIKLCFNNSKLCLLGIDVPPSSAIGRKGPQSTVHSGAPYRLKAYDLRL